MEDKVYGYIIDYPDVIGEIIEIDLTDVFVCKESDSIEYYLSWSELSPLLNRYYRVRGQQVPEGYRFIPFTKHSKGLKRISSLELVMIELNKELK